MQIPFDMEWFDQKMFGVKVVGIYKLFNLALVSLDSTQSVSKVRCIIIWNFLEHN